MAWKTINRNTPVVETDGEPILSEQVREKIKAFFPRYERKRAVLLPALHVVQDALGHVPYKAMVEIAELLDIHPSDVMDTISFYTHFWTHEKGKKVITVCRSLSCELMGGKEVLEAVQTQLGIGIHESSADGRYALVTEECLAGCDHAPCLLVNEKLHKCVRPEDVPALLTDESNDAIEPPRSELFDAPAATQEGGAADAEAAPADADDDLPTTSDIDEMKDAD